VRIILDVLDCKWLQRATESRYTLVTGAKPKQNIAALWEVQG
jgi:hypothetical protein